MNVDELAVATTRFVRFGNFELDLVTQELRRNGIRVRLQNKPFQVLLCLLERAGDVVTREELQQRLWPADTYVDFATGLNTAVNRLRQTLGDAAVNPRFIETLARRGYRFIAPVKWLAAPQSDPAPAISPSRAVGNSLAARVMVMVAFFLLLLMLAHLLRL